MAKPLLSIGMIFKNEIRCLERCMKSLAPLRAAVPCELVMADTGSNDGSREVAEKYADILFDFPWIDDFAAARNAVMDRCSGTWYFSVDADEWLDEDLTELLYFLRNKKAWTSDAAALMIRNYTTENLGATGVYTDMVGVRFLRMSTGIRYTGRVHEMWEPRRGERLVTMRNQILHHDGYVGLSTTVAGALKRHRNMTLLKKQLEEQPDNLRTWLQCIESSVMDPDYLDYLHKATEKIQEKVPNWNIYGAPIIRHAVEYTSKEQLPEAEKWVRMAEEWFPDSLFTALDVGYWVCRNHWEKGEYDECVQRCRRWLEQYRKFAAGEGDHSELLVNSLLRGSPRWEIQIKNYLINAYLYSKNGQENKAMELLRELDGSAMDEEQVGNTVRAMAELHIVSYIDTAPLIISFYDQLNTPKPSEEAAWKRREAFEREAGTYFRFTYLQTESDRTDAKRQAAKLFAPLPCDIGAAAFILGAEDVKEMAEKLSSVEKWDTFPASALLYALEKGVQFPPPGRIVQMEELDALATCLSEEKERYLAYVSGLSGGIGDGPQALSWAKSLVLAAVQSNDWTGQDWECGMDLIRAFAGVERKFLPLCYAPEVLQEHLFLLPPIHRFGWYCAQAFEALDAGDTAQYVHLLKDGLSASPRVKPIVEFLSEHTPQLQTPPPSTELLALAEQVRSMLAAYPPDDPAVAALKQSPAYQSVAQFIEGTEP